MAGKYGAASATFSVEDGPGGTSRTITGQITSEVAAEIRSVMEEVTALGDSSRKFAPVGLTESPSFTVSGPWDTTATTGNHVVLIAPDDGPQDDDREVIIVFGDSKTWTIQCRLMSFKVTASVGALTMFEAEFQPNGVGVWS